MVPGGLCTIPFRGLLAAAPEAQEHRRKTTFFSGTKSRACLRRMSALRQELYKVPALFRCPRWLLLEPEPLCWVLGCAMASCSPRTLQEGLLWLLQAPVHEHFQPGLLCYPERNIHPPPPCLLRLLEWRQGQFMNMNCLWYFSVHLCHCLLNAIQKHTACSQGADSYRGEGLP